MDDFIKLNVSAVVEQRSKPVVCCFFVHASLITSKILIAHMWWCKNSNHTLTYKWPLPKLQIISFCFLVSVIYISSHKNQNKKSVNLFVVAQQQHVPLTCWLLRYNISVLWNRPKTSSFQLPYQLHSSSADCAKELFKPSKDSANLVCTRKKFFGFVFFVSDGVSEVGFWPFCLMLPSLGPNC